MQQQRIKKFQKTIWDFYKRNRREFPWRNTKNPYHILVSEIMLQQTQADRVVPFYQKWIMRFTNIASLAEAKFSDIYPYWQGLGYNRRALNLQKTAQKAVKEFGGKLPADIELLKTFPGIGEYTAKAISIFAFNTPVACIETNIRRVFIHEFFPRKKFVTDPEILKLANLALDKKDARRWHWALMDYGAYLKTQVPNPNRRHKNYSVQSKFEGSLRQIRGAMLRMLSAKPMDSKEIISRIQKRTKHNSKTTKKVISALEKEGLITFRNKFYSLN